MVLIVLAAIVAVIVLIVVRPGSGADAQGGAVTPTGVAGTPGSTGAATGTGADAGAGADAGTGPADAGAGGGADAAADPDAAPGSVGGAAASTGDVVACAGGNISIVAVTDATNYPAGVNPQISFTITNTGSDPCTINAGTSQQLYTITSGDETYWVSTDCQTEASDTQALLEPGVAVASTPFAWDRTRSSTGTCDSADRPQVPAGGASYHLNVSVSGIPAADTQQFILN